MEETGSCIANTYGRQPIALVKGRGARVWDSEGREYIDCFSGLAVANTGHSHPKVVEAICTQAGKIMHTSNIYRIIPQEELARLLFEVSGGYKSFFANSGAEANEAAIKLVRKHTKKAGIIAAKNSFHGRTITTLSATGQDQYKKDFKPMCKEFSHAEYGVLDDIEDKITEKTGAVMLEPIQGEGGVVVPPEGYLKGVRKICDREDILLIFDEVQTGFGRCGSMFAWQAFDVKPDIFTVAKALGSGFPIGVMLARSETMDSFKPGDHASTFGGNHLACAAAKATLEAIIEEGLVERSMHMGEYFRDRLLELSSKYTVIKEVRGMGLMVGAELKIECSDIVNMAREEGILINCAHDTVLRFLPPLVIEKEELDRVVEVLDTILSEIEGE